MVASGIELDLGQPDVSGFDDSPGVGREPDQILRPGRGAVTKGNGARCSEEGSSGDFLVMNRGPF